MARNIYFHEQGLYLYFGLVVVGPVWSNIPENYAVGNVDTSRATHAEEGRGDDPDGKGYLESPGLG